MYVKELMVGPASCGEPRTTTASPGKATAAAAQEDEGGDRDGNEEVVAAAAVKGASAGLGRGECGRRRGAGWREGGGRRRVGRESRRGREAARGIGDWDEPGEGEWDWAQRLARERGSLERRCMYLAAVAAGITGALEHLSCNGK